MSIRNLNFDEPSEIGSRGDAPSAGKSTSGVLCPVCCQRLSAASKTRWCFSCVTAFIRSQLQTVEKNPGPAQDQTENHELRSLEFVQVLVEFLTLFGFKREGFDRRGDVKQWSEWFSQTGDWMKVAKYKLAVFYQYAQKDLLRDKTMPPAPAGMAPSHPLHLLGGRAGRFIRRMLKKSAPMRRQEFLSSVLLVKTGAPRPDDDLVKSSVAKTLEALTIPRTTPWRQQPVLVPGLRDHQRLHGITSFAQLEEHVRGVARELFRGTRFTNRDMLNSWITPSFSANRIRSRKKLGTFGVLREKNFFGTLPKKHLKIYQEPTEEYIGLDVNPSFVLEGFDGARDQFLHTYNSAIRAAIAEDPVAEALGLKEALKVRVITKEPPLTMFALKPVQTFMWKVLKGHPAFELIGGPVEERMLRPRLGDLRGDEGWLSGDYSDATNQLDPRLSEAAWLTVCETCAIPVALRELGLRVLTRHHLVVGNEILPQTWGQLMGSIISFPILCIVNAAVCRMAIEHDRNATVSLQEAPLMVNGDDCLLKVTPKGYEAWNLFGTMAGLKPSVGKVYYSDHFCNVNSTTFLHVPSEDSDARTFQRVSVIRLGLVLGMKRSMSDQETNEPKLNLLGNGVEWDSSLGARHRAVLAECPEEDKIRVHEMFLQKNVELLDVAREHFMPWYVPECYGGLGLEPIGQYGPSEIDRLIVTAMINVSTWRSRTERPPPVPVQWKGFAKTRIHEAALKELRSALGEVPHHYAEAGSSEVDGLDSPSLEGWVLWQLPEEVEAVADDTKLAQVALSQNRRVWSWFLRHMRHFGWMKPGAIVARRLVYDISIRERRPAVLPTRQEIATRELEEDLELRSHDLRPRIKLRRYAASFARAPLDPVLHCSNCAMGPWLSGNAGMLSV